MINVIENRKNGLDIGIKESIRINTFLKTIIMEKIKNKFDSLKQK